MEPSVSITFVLPNEPAVVFDVTDFKPIDVNEVHPDAKQHNTFFEYSGRHDNGELPTLKSTGPIAQVIGALNEMRRISDEFLTEKINAMYGGVSKNGQSAEGQSAAKKMRVENPSEDPLEE